MLLLIWFYIILIWPGCFLLSFCVLFDSQGASSWTFQDKHTKYNNALAQIIHHIQLPQAMVTTTYQKRRKKTYEPKNQLAVIFVAIAKARLIACIWFGFVCYSKTYNNEAKKKRKQEKKLAEDYLYSGLCCVFAVLFCYCILGFVNSYTYTNYLSICSSFLWGPHMYWHETILISCSNVLLMFTPNIQVFCAFLLKCFTYSFLSLSISLSASLALHFFTLFISRLLASTFLSFFLAHAPLAHLSFESRIEIVSP